MSESSDHACRFIKFHEVIEKPLPDYLLKEVPLLVEGQTTVLASKSGQGKTCLIQAMMAMLPKVQWVYYAEQEPHLLQACQRKIGAGCEPIFIDRCLPTLAYDKKGKPDAVKFWARLPALGGKQGVVVIDTAPDFGEMLFTEFNDNQNNDVRKLFAFLQPVLDAGYTLLLTCHVSEKANKKDTNTTIMGASAWKTVPDRTFFLNRTHNIYNIFPDKRRGGQEEPFALQSITTFRIGIMEFVSGLKRCGVEEEADEDFKVEESQRKRVLDAINKVVAEQEETQGSIARHKTFRVKDVRQLCKMKGQVVSDTLRQLAADGLLKSAPAGYSLIEHKSEF